MKDSKRISESKYVWGREKVRECVCAYLCMHVHACAYVHVCVYKSSKHQQHSCTCVLLQTTLIDPEGALFHKSLPN